jgi:hypothetical protein
MPLLYRTAAQSSPDAATNLEMGKSESSATVSRSSMPQRRGKARLRSLTAWRDLTRSGWWLELGPDLLAKPIANRYMRFVVGR